MTTSYSISAHSDAGRSELETTAVEHLAGHNLLCGWQGALGMRSARLADHTGTLRHRFTLVEMISNPKPWH